MASPWLQRPVLVAPDSFKGSLRASQVAGAVARGLEAAGLPPSDLCPVADGGEGTLEVLLAALGGELRGAQTTDPLGRPIRTSFALIDDGQGAIVEVAEASGLQRIKPSERTPETAAAASTAGTGELMLAAAGTGAQTILLAAGGSATTDGGAGALSVIEAAGGLGAVSVVVLCDVRTPFELAAQRFAAQKGASDAQTVRRLSARLLRQASRLRRDPCGVPMSGAAGGLAGGLWANLGARLVPGAAFVLDALSFDSRMRAARAVVVGEGSMDRGTLEGKVAAEIAVRARQAGVPAHAIVGVNRLERFDARILDLQTITEAGDLRGLEHAGLELASVL